MADEVVDALIFDLLNWLNRGDRAYEDVMNAWRTSCPKLPIWEEANDRGFVETETAGERRLIRVSRAGRAFIAVHRAKTHSDNAKQTA